MDGSYLRKAVNLSVMLCVLGGFGSFGTASYADLKDLSANAKILQQGLQNLDAMTPGMDDETKKHMGAMKTMLEHVCLDRQHATDSELKVAAVLLRTDTSRQPADVEKQLRDSLNQMPGIASAPQFISGSRLAPGGEQIGYVNVVVSGRTKTVVELPSGTTPQNVAQKAVAVATGMQAAQAKDPLWWTQLVVIKTERGYGVGAQAPGNLQEEMIAADPAFAKEWGLDPQGLAKQVIFSLRTAMDASTPDPQDITPEQAYQDAVDQRQAGDEAFSGHDSPAAEKNYLAAIRSVPGYVIPYERLAKLYYEQQAPDKAHALLTKALALKGLTRDAKRDLQQMLTLSK